MLSFAITSPAATGSAAPSSTPVAAIAGGSVAEVVTIALVVTGAIIFYRGDRRPPEDDGHLPELNEEEAIAGLKAQPPELGGDRANMVELPGPEAVQGAPSGV